MTCDDILNLKSINKVSGMGHHYQFKLINDYIWNVWLSVRVAGSYSWVSDSKFRMIGKRKYL